MHIAQLSDNEHLLLIMIICTKLHCNLQETEETVNATNTFCKDQPTPHTLTPTHTFHTLFAGCNNNLILNTSEAKINAAQFVIKIIL